MEFRNIEYGSKGKITMLKVNMLILQLICTALGVFSAAVMVEEAVYVSDFFCCIAVVTGILAVREVRLKKQWLIHTTALALIACNVVFVLINHGIIESLITE